jgi:hypothetical protein
MNAPTTERTIFDPEEESLREPNIKYPKNIIKLNIEIGFKMN